MTDGWDIRMEYEAALTRGAMFFGHDGELVNPLETAPWRMFKYAFKDGYSGFEIWEEEDESLWDRQLTQ
jgi:hypothetical protein